MSAVFAPSSPDWSDGQIKARIEALNRIGAAWRSIGRDAIAAMRANLRGDGSFLAWCYDSTEGQEARARDDESRLLLDEVQQEWALFTRGLGQARIDAYITRDAADNDRFEGDDVTIRGATMVAGVDF